MPRPGEVRGILMGLPLESITSNFMACPSCGAVQSVRESPLGRHLECINSSCSGKSQRNHPQSTPPTDPRIIVTPEPPPPLKVANWPLDAAHIFSADGPLSGFKADFVPRPEQGTMAKAVEAGLKAGGTHLIEAGTGVGKSLAYLVPAAIWAINNDKRVIVSTHTKALQEQLIQKELPFAKELLAARGLGLRFSLLMGGENYLCVQRLDRLLRDKDNMFLDPDGRKALEGLWSWSATGETGQRARLPSAVRDDLWPQVNRDPDLCMGNRGPYAERCLWRKDYEKAKKAHILVVNHALLLAAPPAWLPYDALVLDEAHNLEDVAANNLGFTLSALRVERLLNDLYNAETARGLVLSLKTLDPTIVGTIRGLVTKAHAANKAFFAEAQKALSLASGFVVGNNSSARRILKPDLVPDTLSPTLRPISSELAGLISHAGTKEQEDLIAAIRKRFDAVDSELKAFLANDNPDMVFWGELRISRKKPTLELKMAPVHVGEALHSLFFSKEKPVFLTSATLSANKSFQIFRERMGVLNANETLVDSPFDYANRVRLYIPKDLPNPKGDAAKSVENVVEHTLALEKVVPGGIFVLFTSWKMLKAVESKLRSSLEGRKLFVQGSARPEDLLSEFQKAGHGVLLGTDTYWQGVDVPGDALSCVILTRLPFTSPESPLEQARNDWYTAQGKNPFSDFSLPRAIVKFRQGFGRLMRRHDDRGVVVVLDPRIKTMKFGQQFLGSLPSSLEIADASELTGFFQGLQSTRPTG